MKTCICLFERNVHIDSWTLFHWIWTWWQYSGSNPESLQWDPFTHIALSPHSAYVWKCESIKVDWAGELERVTFYTQKRSLHLKCINQWGKEIVVVGSNATPPFRFLGDLHIRWRWEDRQGKNMAYSWGLIFSVGNLIGLPSRKKSELNFLVLISTF